jgi:hypothetical protein
MHGYDKTAYFQGVLEMPPAAINLMDWIGSYGGFPKVKTAKGVLSKEQICKCLAHYLG